MCGRYTITARPEELVRHFGLPEQLDFAARYNLAPTQLAPVVRAGDSGRFAAMLRWGLVPFWADDVKIGNRMINARSETAPKKPAFRASFKQKRCLVPADGFYEWRTEQGGKQPYYIRLAEGELFAFAGLWDLWKSKDDEKVVESFTILTTDASDAVKDLHDRMPVILNPGDYEAWLDPTNSDFEGLQSLMRPYDGGDLNYYPVSREMNRPIEDDPSMIEPIPRYSGDLFTE